MIPMVCTCGSLLGHIEIEYEKQIKILLKSNDKVFAVEKKKIIDSLVPREKWCCKSYLLTPIDIVRLMKG